MIIADDSAVNTLERFDNGVDDDNGVDVTFNDAVNARAYDASSGVSDITFDEQLTHEHTMRFQA